MSNSAFIDGKEYTFSKDESLMNFVRKHIGESSVPSLCYDPLLKPTGSCRLCSVEISIAKDSPKKVVASCHTPVTNGLHIFSKTEKIEKLRKGIIELVCSNIPEETIYSTNSEVKSEFTKVIDSQNNIDVNRYPSILEKSNNIEDHPYIKFSPDSCIDCFRCVEACDQVQGQFALNRHGRGFHGKILPGSRDQKSFIKSSCVSCGLCVQVCPTDALNDRHLSKTTKSDSTVTTTCTYCGVGCNLIVNKKDNKIAFISGDREAEVNGGHTCLKGRYAFEYYKHPDRLKSPLIKKNGKFEEVSWEEANTYIAEQFKKIKDQHGPDSIGGLSSSRCTNEENYLLQKFIRAIIKTNNIDCCARVCHAPTAFGMQQTYGTGAATNSIEEIASTNCMLIIGANPTDAHPVTGAKIKQRALKGIPLIVIDPMKTELANLADVHLQLKPGTNVALLNMFAHYILSEELEDSSFVKNRTEGYEGYKTKLLNINIDELESITGVKRELVKEAAKIYASADKAMAFHGLGVTEHFQGSKTVMLIASIVMLTGNIGKFGAGLNPLRGQNNVQGAADMGCQPHLGAGYLDVTNPDHIKHYEKFYGTGISPRIGLTTPEMLMSAVNKDIRALWIMGEDIMQSDPDTNFIEKALDNLDFLVVQELFMTQTAEKASVVLPASSHLEKEGTFTNGERRVQRVNQVVEPLEGTKSDGQIIIDVMNAMGYSQPDYNAKELLKEISQVIPFFAGITWENLKNNGRQWPVTKDGTDTQILHQETFKLGLGRFKFFEYEESPELINHSKKFPLILTTGRILEHYNCGTMTRRTPNADIAKDDILLIHPIDAQKRNLTNLQEVLIQSARGETRIKIEISEKVDPGVVYTTFHYPETEINKITSCVMDIESQTPEYKVVAVDLKST